MMVNMHEAKSTLSKLVELVQNGEEVVIAKAGNPVALLKPYNKLAKKRNPGALKGTPFDMSRFDEADEEIRLLFDGDD
ncbi:MAG: type II toxin-antitoxin system prevent-host-death family antitoxin [Pseudomonadota bacterium]|nr:type II toxin-antitoxin system prevent-host-death family antitoxin [Pseudomonadota bacterium]